MCALDSDFKRIFCNLMFLKSGERGCKLLYLGPSEGCGLTTTFYLGEMSTLRNGDSNGPQGSVYNNDKTPRLEGTPSSSITHPARGHCRMSFKVLR